MGKMLQRVVKNLKYAVNLEGISRGLSKSYGSSVMYSAPRDKVGGRTSVLRVQRGREKNIKEKKTVR